MKRILVALLVTVFAANALAPTAQAQGYLGEFCFGFVGYTDRLKLAVTANGNAFELHGQWTSISYEVAVSGSAFVRRNGTVEFALQGPNNSVAFSGQPLLTLRANLSTSSLGGSYSIKGIGDGSPFSNSGSLAFMSCLASDPRLASDARPSAGDGKGQ